MQLWFKIRVQDRTDGVCYVAGKIFNLNTTGKCTEIVCVTNCATITVKVIGVFSLHMCILVVYSPFFRKSH